MKRYLYLLIIIIGVSACKIDDIKVYDSTSFISFTRTEKDTMIVSFFMLGGLSEYECPIILQHIGIPSLNEKEFSISVVPEHTTMKNGSYILPSTMKFKPMSMYDTLYFKLLNYPELATSEDLICIELNESRDFLMGDRNFRRLFIKVSDMIAQPDWWTAEVITYYLGKYSDTKFKLFVEVVKPDFSEVNISWIRSWALQFKAYLDSHPTLDEDGLLMTITVRI